MGQQPNVPVSIEDLPRHTAHPPAPSRWSPNRPGDLNGPAAQPSGGRFGTPGPDAGYALRLVKRRTLPGGAHHARDVVVLVAAVVTARAAALGRAPVPADIDAALALLALDDASAAEAAGIAHDHARLRSRISAIPPERLVLPAARLTR